MIQVSSNIEDIVRKYRHYPDRVVTAATQRALNDTGSAVRTEYGTVLKRELPELRGSAGRGVTRLTRATRRRLVARVSMTGAPIPIKYFGARKTSDGLRVTLAGKTVTVRGAFRIKAKSNHWFVRTESKRIPYATQRRAKGTGPRKDPRKLRMVYGLPPPRVITDKTLRGELSKLARERFTTRMQYHVSHLAKRS